MCEHDEDTKKYIIPRIAGAIVLFISGFWFKPLFLISYLLAGGDVLFRALKNIIKGHIFDENFLMSLATIGAICIKEFPEACMVMILYQMGEFMQDRAVDKSRESIAELMDIRPDYANLDGEKVPPQSVKIGDIIVVKTGEKIPLDGVVIDGKASLDTSALTGESVPRYAEKGIEVVSGCINLDGVLKIRVTKQFGESTVSKILELVENASARKAQTENFITKFAKYYTPAVVFLAFIIAIIPPFYIERALTFLVISCPCALVISIPLSFFAGIGGASKKGILIKGSSSLETLSKAKNVVFDKTGTLTKGIFKVTEIHSENPHLIEYAARAESASSHPIARAIREAYGDNILPAEDISEVAGHGVRAIVDGKEILAGNAMFVNTEPVETSGTVVYVSIDGKNEGYIVISDEIKESAENAVKELKKITDVVMLTGDSVNAGKKIAAAAGIDNYYTELLPKNKVEKLEEIMKNGVTIFAGDGINDAPALMRADVGIAMGSLGSDAAIEAADVVIMDDNPLKVYTAIKSARKTMTIVRENIIFALTIKLLFLILGSYGLISMWGAVFADVGVSIIAILNALRGIRD